MLGFAGAPASSAPSISSSPPGLSPSSRGANQDSTNTFTVEHARATAAAEGEMFALSRIVGSGITLDLDELEIATSGGLLRYTPSKSTFEVGTARWDHKVNANEHIFLHNGKPFWKVQLNHKSGVFRFDLDGTLIADDLLLSKDLGMIGMVNLCKSDRRFSRQTDLAVESCSVDMDSVHLTVQEKMEYISKLLFAIVTHLTSSDHGDSGRGAAAAEIVLQELTQNVSSISERMAGLFADWHAGTGAEPSLRSELDAVAGELSNSVARRLGQLGEDVLGAAEERFVGSDAFEASREALRAVNESCEGMSRAAAAEAHSIRQQLRLLQEIAERVPDSVSAAEVRILGILNSSISAINDSLHHEATLSAEDTRSLLEEAQNRTAQAIDKLTARTQSLINNSSDGAAAAIRALNRSVVEDMLLPMSEANHAAQARLNHSLVDLDDRVSSELLDAARALNKRIEAVNVSQADNAAAVVSLSLNLTALQRESAAALLELQRSSAAEQAALAMNVSQDIARSEALQSLAVAAVNASLESVRKSLTQAIVDVYAHADESVNLSQEQTAATIHSLRDAALSNITELRAAIDESARNVTIARGQQLAELSAAVKSDLEAHARAVQGAFDRAEANHSASISEMHRAADATRDWATDEFSRTRAELAALSDVIGSAVQELTATTSAAELAIRRELREQNMSLHSSIAAASEGAEDRLQALSSTMSDEIGLLHDSFSEETRRLNAAVKTLNSTMAAQRAADSDSFAVRINESNARFDAAHKAIAEVNGTLHTMLSEVDGRLRVDLLTASAALEHRLQLAQASIDDELLRLQNESTAASQELRRLLQAGEEATEKTVAKIATDSAAAVIAESNRSRAALQMVEQELYSAMLNVSADLLALNATLHSRIGREVGAITRLIAEKEKLHRQDAIEHQQQVEDLRIEVADAQLSSETLFANLESFVRKELRRAQNESRASFDSLGDELFMLNSSLSLAARDTAASVQQQLSATALRIDALQSMAELVNSSRAADYAALVDQQQRVQEEQQAALLAAVGGLREEGAQHIEDLRDAVRRNISLLATAAEVQMEVQQLSKLLRDETATAAARNGAAVQEVGEMILQSSKQLAAEVNSSVLKQQLELVDVQQRQKVLEFHVSLALGNVTADVAAVFQQIVALNSTLHDTNALLAAETNDLSLEVHRLEEEAAVHRRKQRDEMESHLLSLQRGFEQANEEHQSAVVKLSGGLEAVRAESGRHSNDLEGVHESIRQQRHSLDDIVADLTSLKLETSTLGSDRSHFMQQQRSLFEALQNVSAVALPAMAHEIGGAIATALAHHDALQLLRGESDRVEDRVSALQSDVFQSNIAMRSRFDALNHSVAAAASELSGRLSTLEAANAVALQRLADQAKSGENRQRASETTLTFLEKEIDSLRAAHGDSQHALSALKAGTESCDKLAVEVAALQARVAENQRTCDQQHAGQRDALSSLSARLVAAEAAVQRQQSEIAALEDENRRILRDMATQESVDQLRKLLFDLQTSMVGHSSKVLDVLLQKSDA